MDYDVINAAIEEIIGFVKDNERFRYNEKLSENLVVSLLGYYLVLGADIFKTITVVLKDLAIYRCQSDFDYICRIKMIDNDFPNSQINLQPITYYKDCYDNNHHFLGYSPYIVYKQADDIAEVLILSHELSHVIDGANATITRNQDNCCDIKIAFSQTHIDETNHDNSKMCESGFGEFAAVALENKILEALKTLDPNKINYDFIKLFIYDLSMSNANISKAYTYRYVAFKDLIDNPKFFALMQKYYYEQSNEEEFKKAYESFDSELSFDKLKRYIMIMFDVNKEFDYLKFYEIVNEEVRKFNEKTNHEGKKEILIMS